MNVQAALRAVEDEVLKLVFEIGLHLEQFQPEHLGVDHERIRAAVPERDRLVDEVVGLRCLLGDCVDGPFEDLALLPSHGAMLGDAGDRADAGTRYPSELVSAFVQRTPVRRLCIRAIMVSHECRGWSFVPPFGFQARHPTAALAEGDEPGGGRPVTAPESEPFRDLRRRHKAQRKALHEMNRQLAQAAARERRMRVQIQGLTEPGLRAAADLVRKRGDLTLDQALALASEVFVDG